MAEKVDEIERYSIITDHDGKQYFQLMECRVNPKGLKSLESKPEIYLVDNPK